MLKGKEYPSTALGASRQPWKNILVGAIVLFFLTQLAASFFSVDPVYSLFSSIERMDGVLQYGFWALYFFMFLSVFRKEQDWKVFFSVFIGVALLLSGYSWLSAGSQQLSGIFGNPAYFAAFLLFAIGFSLLAFERKFFYPRPLHYALLAAVGFFVLTLVFTQVRGVYVGLAGGVFLFCLLAILFLRKKHKKLALASGAVLLVGFVSLGVLFAVKDSSFVQNTRLLYRVTEVVNFWESDSVRERVLNWNIALKAFSEKPIFGYGPENFGSAANKYYDYRIGEGEPWFDRAHNQLFDTLATGGIVVFLAYLFWLGAAAFLIFKIARKQKVLGFLLASVFLAYFLQGLFLFDLLAVYLGLFPFLAFLVYQYNRDKDSNDHKNYAREQSSGTFAKQLPILGLVGVLSLFVVYATAFVPYKANAAALQFYGHSQNGLYKESLPFLKEALSIQSPYATWEVRKRVGWQFVQVLEYEIGEETAPEKIRAIQEIYDTVTPELEKFIEARPHDPQIYYVLGKTYRVGSQKLGRNDLGKAEATLQKGFVHSDLRIEYYNEFAQVSLAQGKIEEAEQVLADYTQRVPVEWGKEFPFLTLGHFYFVAGEHGKALEQYERAREVGHSFVDTAPEYSRYLYVAEETGDYQKVLEMAKAYLERWGPDADTYFNIAVSHYNLGDREQAATFFLKAVALKPEYESHRSLFME